jgi:hypothetical protein
MFHYSETEKRVRQEHLSDGSQRTVERIDRLEVTGPRALVHIARRLFQSLRH